MSQQYKKFLLAKTRVFYCFTERGFAEIMASNPGIDCRALGLLRRGVDMIVLRDTESNRSEWKNAKATFGYSEDQVIWKQSNKDWLFSTPIELELEEDLSMILAHINCHQDVLIVPRVVYPEFVAACNAHKLDFVGTLQNYHEGKGCLYTNNMVIDALNFEHHGVSVTTLRGRTGITKEKLRKAADSLIETGITKAIFKPKDFAGGVGVQLIDLLSDNGGISNVPTRFSEMEWILEEYIEAVVTIDIVCWGVEVLVVADQIQAGPSGFTYTGNLFPSTATREVQEASRIMCQKLASLLKIDCP